MNNSCEELVKYYLSLRDYKASFKKYYEDTIAETDEKMRELEEQFSAMLESAGVVSMNTPVGRIGTRTTTSYTTEDSELLRQYLERTGDLDMVSVRPKKEAVEHYLAENNALPPGVGVFAKTNVVITKPRGA